MEPFRCRTVPKWGRVSNGGVEVRRDLRNESAQTVASPEDWLRVELRVSGEVCTLVLSGVLSGTSIAALEAQVDQLSCTACGDVVLDVRRLKELDRTGASALSGLYHYVKARGGRYRIVGATDQVARMISECIPESVVVSERRQGTLPRLVPPTTR